MKSAFTKKTLLLLALLTAAGCISCGGEAQKPLDTKGGTEEPTETGTETSEPAYEPETKDLGKYTFRILVTDDPEREQQNVYHEEMDGEPINDALHLRDAEVEDRLNVQFNWMIYDNNEDNYMRELVVKSVSSGSDDYDMVIGSPWFVVMRCDYQHVYIDLCELEALSLSESWWSPEAYNNLRMGGKLYFTVCPISPMYYGVPSAVFFNKTMMTNYDLGNPYEWVKNGTWTFDKLFSITDDFAQDLNSDGKMIFGEDLYGFSCNNVGLFTVGANLKEIVALEDGYINNFMDERLVTLSQKVGERMSDGGHYGIGDWTEGFRNGLCLFVGGSLQSCWGSALRDANDDFGILPPPKYDEEQKGYHSSASSGPAAGVCVPQTVEDYDRHGMIMENMAFYSEKYIRPATHDVTILGKSTRDAESMEMLELIYDSVDYSINSFLNIANSFNTLGTCILGNSQLTTVYPRIEKNLLKELNNLFGS